MSTDTAPDAGIRLLLGDSREVLKTLADDSVDSVVTDPPYHLTSTVKRFGKPDSAPAQHGTDGAYARASRGFMGQTWDGGDISFQPEFWAEVLRVLKPGGHMVAFGGSRTYHRMACAIEDGGFEIRDQIQWIYGSGFPKSHDQGDGFGTALKPAHEPIVLARKPLIGSIAANVAAHGTGALNIDGCRIATSESLSIGSGALGYQGADGSNAGSQNALGRWPANVIHDGSDEVVEGFPSAPGQQADIVNDSSRSKNQNVYGAMKRGEHEASKDRLYSDKGGTSFTMKPGARRADSGSAARFFYCAKASRRDRNEGLPDPGPQFQHGDTLRAAENAEKKGNHHPTVKPTDLMRYLCRLITPPGGIVLDPFMGSGSTGKGAAIEGFKFIGIEMSEEYLEIARARIAFVDEPEPEPVPVVLPPMVWRRRRFVEAAD